MANHGWGQFLPDSWYDDITESMTRAERHPYCKRSDMGAQYPDCRYPKCQQCRFYTGDPEALPGKGGKCNSNAPHPAADDDFTVDEVMKFNEFTLKDKIRKILGE